MNEPQPKRAEPRPFHERFVERFNIPAGHEAVLCMCGNLFQRPIGSRLMRCSKVCARRYEDVRSPFEKPLMQHG